MNPKPHKPAEQGQRDRTRTQQAKHLTQTRRRQRAAKYQGVQR